MNELAAVIATWDRCPGHGCTKEAWEAWIIDMAKAVAKARHKIKRDRSLWGRSPRPAVATEDDE